MHKIIVIVGQTASGKSELAVKVAKRVNGSIISCDSRQVYRGLSLGSGKVPLDAQGQYKGVDHYGLNIASPKRVYTAAMFQRYAQNVIQKIIKQGKTPILCGGTGLWIDAVVYGQAFPEVSPEPTLRKQLSKKTLPELQALLKKLDKSRYKNIDTKNSHRLIRAIEIAKTLGKVPKLTKPKPKYDTFFMAPKINQEDLDKKILKRLKQRISQGLIREVKTLLKQGITHKRLQTLGLEYKYVSLYLQNKLSKKELIETLATKIRQYSRRQLTWFKRNKSIHWV